MHVNIDETKYLITLFTQCSVLQVFHRGAYNRKYRADVSAIARESGLLFTWHSELGESVSHMWTRR